jgi:hypothetical protein
MRLCVVSAFLLATAPLLAQSNSSQAVLVSPPHSIGCPVALSARYSSVGAVRQTAKDAPHSALGYTVTFKPLNAHSIVQAKLTFHGLDGAQIMPAKSLGTSNATEDFTVAPSATDNQRFESIVYAQKLTGVQWIELDDITYADGTHWQKSANSVCLVVPSHLRLVNAQRTSK